MLSCFAVVIDNSITIFCPLCGAKFPDVYVLDKHILRCHPGHVPWGDDIFQASTRREASPG